MPPIQIRQYGYGTVGRWLPLNLLAGSFKAPTILEIGTSFGYSGIWLAEAARASGGRVISMELHAYKSAYAKDMAERAGLADFFYLRVGDAIEMAGGKASTTAMPKCRSAGRLEKPAASYAVYLA